MIIVGVRAGLRIAEPLALRWEDVDLVSGRVVVRQGLSREVISTPKNGTSREIP
jgi:integrase